MIPKAFDKGRHEEIILKRMEKGILDDLLHALSDFLKNREQKLRLMISRLPGAIFMQEFPTASFDLY